jgi:hypothetical protein
MRQRHGEDDQRIYRSFQEFERDELRRMETAGSSVDEMIDSIFEEELDFDLERHAKRRAAWDAGDDEE